MVGLEAAVAETRDTGFPQGAMAAQWILHSCKGDSLCHLFRLYPAVLGARVDPGDQREPKDKTKSEGSIFLSSN